MSEETFNLLLKLWDEYRPLIQEGYQVLDKTLVLGLPATSMPPATKDQDSGVGSPYGEGAARIWQFWHNVINKIMLGPLGKTDAKTWHSPYLASWDYNPFFIDLSQLVKQRLLPAKELKKIYEKTKIDGYIDFKQVEQDYTHALTLAWEKSHSKKSFDQFCNDMVRHQMDRSAFTYITDIPVNVPTRISSRHPDWFLKDFSLGAPPDNYSPKPQKWGFLILNPNALFTHKASQPLGPAGRVFKRLLSFYLRGNKGGTRIDHFIGWVDPYCFYTGKKHYKNGRLYSSPKHPLLKKYYYKDRNDFLRMTAEFLMPLIRQFNLSSMDIYPEDLGIRPEPMDHVLRTFHLGKMLPAQFNDPKDKNHMYHFANALPEDVAVLDTHDNPSLQDFFASLPIQDRTYFAKELAEDLRFNYTNDLCQPDWLYRMQWAAALASPSKRVMVFFTTLMGQKGRYNTPGVLDSWHLRCRTNFEEEYFKALKQGKAYNPFEAICWAIYAKGDDFFHQHESLIHRLRAAEETFFKTLQDL